MSKQSRQASANRSKPKETSKVDYTVGERVRELRETRNLSQRSLGELIGVTFQQVQKYEKGTNRITVARLNDICSALNVGFDYFLGKPLARADGMSENETPSLSPQLSEDEKSLLKSFRNVSSARRRKAIVSLIQDMAEE